MRLCCLVGANVLVFVLTALAISSIASKEGCSLMSILVGGCSWQGKDSSVAQRLEQEVCSTTCSTATGTKMNLGMVSVLGLR